MSKTDDIEYAIIFALADGPMCLEVLEQDLPYVDDRRWIGVALMHLERGGRIRFTSCERSHSHDGACVVEVLS